ncbi:hypothetical protein PILCRDRAFT_260770 [Piloderma croceum F 1598]|uniref:Uncharacterized protein n=1 Tax=Piloderma croceum (strain F 1598) TaxID=765440 RepID=A0A0C3FTT9_PILCF|nr:hypothetical protein PILCRDRAFT_260770 [Piloderma croceum F 1598]
MHHSASRENRYRPAISQAMNIHHTLSTLQLIIQTRTLLASHLSVRMHPRKTPSNELKSVCSREYRSYFEGPHLGIMSWGGRRRRVEGRKVTKMQILPCKTPVCGAQTEGIASGPKISFIYRGRIREREFQRYSCTGWETR